MRRILFAALVLFTSCQQKPTSPIDPCTYFNGIAMTMPYHIVIGKPLTRSEKKTVQTIIQTTFDEVHLLFDNWNPDSEISKLNASPAYTPIAISPQLEHLLTLCNQIHAVSGGRFDPTIEPLHTLWRNALLEKTVPSIPELQKACDALGWNHIEVKEGYFQKDNPETRLDLCSIAKGICIDWITERLQKVGHKDLLVDWDGVIRASGHHPHQTDWTIQIDPALVMNGKPLPPISLKNMSLATSGDSHQLGWTLPPTASADHELHRFFPIIDPLSAQPLEKTSYSIASSTVTAPTAAFADALATAAMLFHGRIEAEMWAQEVIDLYPQISFWILSYRNDNGN
jgi:FAD:protein FMN transferase